MQDATGHRCAKVSKREEVSKRKGRRTADGFREEYPDSLSQRQTTGSRSAMDHRAAKSVPAKTNRLVLAVDAQLTELASLQARFTRPHDLPTAAAMIRLPAA